MTTNFDLTEEQQHTQKLIRDFAKKVIAPKAAEIDDSQEMDLGVFQELGKLGLLGIPWDERYGGAGLDYLTYAICVEEIARVCGSTALGFAAHVSLGTAPIVYRGSEAQKQKYLPPLCRGEYLGSFGLTEPEAGSDAGGIRTKAVKKGDCWLINGGKRFITNATYCGSLVITAKTDPQAEGSRGITAFIVERDTPGFSLGRKEDKLGMRGSDTRELIFEDMSLPDQQILGDLHRGFPVFMQTLDAGRISIGALALGLAQGAFDQAVEYARRRRQFGQTIGSFQAIQQKIADMAVGIEAARHLIYHAARLKDAGRPFTKESAMAKLFASEIAMQATYDAIQIFGGYGYTKDYPVERFWRDAKLCEIGEGTSEVQRLVIARDVLGRL